CAVGRRNTRCCGLKEDDGARKAPSTKHQIPNKSEGPKEEGPKRGFVALACVAEVALLVCLGSRRRAASASPQCVVANHNSFAAALLVLVLAPSVLEFVWSLVLGLWNLAQATVCLGSSAASPQSRVAADDGSSAVRRCLLLRSV